MNFILNSLSVGLSVLAGVTSVVTYFVHDRKIKNQQEQLNRIMLDKALNADIAVSLNRTLKCLEVVNNGGAKAREVRVAIEPDIRNRPREFPFPLDMEPNCNIPVSINCGISAPYKVKVAVDWLNMDNQNNHKESVIVLRA